MEGEMKFCLVNKQPCDLERAFTSKLSKTVELDLTGALLRYRGDTALFDKFKKALDRKLLDQSRKMVVEFTPAPLDDRMYQRTSTTGFASNLWSVTLKSDVLKAVHAVLHDGNPDIALQIELQVQGTTLGPYGCSSDGSTTNVYGFAPQKVGNGVVSQKCYEKKQVDIQMRPRIPYTRNWCLTIEVIGSDFVYFEDAPPSCSDLNRKLFNSKNFCDFEITSEDGTVIPCHKMFLCEKSTVFAQMLLPKDAKFKEAVENKMTIGDMSTRGINALLQYLYCYDVRPALAHCDVALELLMASDKYDIPDLWNSVARILEKKSMDWYNVDVALKLSSFAANCQRQECEKLEKKMIAILATKSEQLSNSTVFSELFPTPVSRRMFKLSLEATKTGGSSNLILL